MDRSSFEENRKLIASNLAIAESNNTMSKSTTKASLDIINAIDKIDIASLVAVNQQILATLKELVKVLTPAPIKGPVESIKEIDG